MEERYRKHKDPNEYYQQDPDFLLPQIIIEEETVTEFNEDGRMITHLQSRLIDLTPPEDEWQAKLAKLNDQITDKIKCIEQLE